MTPPPSPNWHHTIDPRDWAAMTRQHESTHVAASEALGIPVTQMWANPDINVAHGGNYTNGAGDSQHQSVVYLIGAEGGAEELRDRGYDDDIVHQSVMSLGYSDRQKTHDVIAQAGAAGYVLDGRRAYDDALAILHSPGFKDVAHNVAQALEDQGDRLTGADVRAAMRGFQLDNSLWVPAWNQLDKEPHHATETPALQPAHALACRGHGQAEVHPQEVTVHGPEGAVWSPGCEPDRPDPGPIGPEPDPDDLDIEF
ncbi:hypothetical protein [Streptomyces sp. NPDC055036]